ncbi:Hypothetical predicted protein [Lecanosticta acicola]|uniref:Uncharacterized protein n=1 Tax=Lecanosticta acicola TaxID=111012 RepID=A0AAI8YX84_9PEZI|nr:Hypothetical predicted protein [Lecanosticta acicola]
MGTKLDTLPVEIIREIYRHLLCPGIITVHQLPRDEPENDNGQVPSEGREMRIEASQNCNALGYNRILDQAFITHEQA